MTNCPQYEAHTSVSGGRYGLRVNSFDRVSSLLVAMLVLTSTAVAVLVTIFLFRQFSPEVDTTTTLRPTTLAQVPTEFGEDIQPAGVEEAPTDSPPELQETLLEVTNAISTKTAALANKVVHSDRVAAHGPPGDTAVYAEAERMPMQQLRFDPQSDLDYAQMIDYFGGELAVLDRRSNRVHYAKNLSQNTPDLRSGTPEEENKASRFRFLSSGALKEIESRLATKLGIMKPGGIVLVFYPDETTRLFFAMEEAEMRSNGYTSLEEVESTAFRVTRDGHQFEITVEQQKYH